MTCPAIDHDLAGLSDFVVWFSDPDADPSLYRYDDRLGWIEADDVRDTAVNLIVRFDAASLRPFVCALADVLVADLLSIPPGNR